MHLTARHRAWIQGTVVVMAMVLAIGLQRRAGLHDWFIEDAAISFAYARNLAEGHGLVPWVGGEPVEGYSNPTWTFLLSLGWRLGQDPFALSKILGGVFSALTVPLAWLVAREALPGRHWTPLVAPVLLAVNPQQAIWAASGLENSLFNLLLAAALWRGLLEARTRAPIPWSALLWAGLALTRPEGVLYAAVGGALFLGTTVRAQGLRPTLWWLGLFWGPVLTFEAWRLAYFAWPLPNTYYAKDRWHGLGWWEVFPGWRQLRDWASALLLWRLAPLIALGAAGRRWPLALIIGALGAVLLLPLPEGWVVVKPWLVLLLGLLGLAGIGSGPGWPARAGSWGLGGVAVFFAVWSGGDWMNGFRWYAAVAVPMSVLAAAGAGTVAGWLPPVTAPLLAGVGVFLGLAPSLVYLEVWSEKQETTPFMVKKRVDYMTGVAERLWIDEPVVAWDVDQGAHLWWSDFQMMDMAGLIDVPVAHHRWETAFLSEYLFEESRPHFAHVHGGWAKGTGLDDNLDFERTYIEIPPYGPDRGHGGNHVRRDLILTEHFPGPRSRVRFDNQATVVGLHTPSPQTARGRSFYVEIGVQGRGEPFRILLFATDGDDTQVWELPPAYDWVPIEDWRFGEIFVGRFGLELQDRLEPGTYDLGMVILAEDGVAKPTEWPESVEVPETPAVARGEVRLGTLEVVTVAENAANAREDRERALGAAEAGRCVDAEQAWKEARMHRALNRDWWAEYEPVVRPALAGCWARSAGGERGQALQALRRAREWDVTHPEVIEKGRALADELVAAGEAARAAGDHETAYPFFRDALSVDPERPWVRRMAEESRDIRLGIDSAALRQERRERRLQRLEAGELPGRHGEPDER